MILKQVLKIHLFWGSLVKNRNLWWHSDYLSRSLVLVEIKRGIPGVSNRGYTEKKMLLNQKHFFLKACILLIHKNILQEPINML